MIGARDKNRGFTLLEVMIATALLASLGLMLLAMFGLIINGQEYVRETRDRLHAARVALNLMARDISMAYLSSHVDEEQRRQTFFDGQGDRIDLTTLAHRRLVAESAESDQAEVGYMLGRDRRYPGETVLIRRTKVPIDDRPGDGGDEDVVAVGVKRLSLEYWDARKEDWNDDWQVDFDDIVYNDPEAGAGLAEEGGEREAMLPYRVRITLTVEDSEGGDLALQTQTPLYMRRVLRFNAVAAKGKGPPTGPPRTKP